MNEPWAGFLISSAAWQGVPHGQAISSVREAGFGGVEILCKPGHFECDNSDHVEEVGAALTNWPDAIVTFHAPFYDLDLASSDPDAWDAAMHDSLRALEVASLFRAETMTVHVRSIPMMSYWDASNLRAFRRTLGQLATAAEKQGMTLAVENLPPPCFSAHEEDLMCLLNEFPAAGACIDTGHAHLGGRAIELASRLAPRAFVAHLHDNHGEGDKHLLPGRGTIPWKEVVWGLVGFRGRKVIESVNVRDFDALKRALVETGLCELP